jgi:transposase
MRLRLPITLWPRSERLMWTPVTRRQHSRTGLRYETDLTDAEWAVIEPLLPPPPKRGRPRFWPMREIMNAIFYVLRGGIAWRLLPRDLPPKSTVYRWFALWRDTGLFETLNHLLVMADREQVGREASPSAAVIDSQSVKTTESGAGPNSQPVTGCEFDAQWRELKVPSGIYQPAHDQACRCERGCYGSSDLPGYDCRRGMVSRVPRPRRQRNEAETGRPAKAPDAVPARSLGRLAEARHHGRPST